MKYTKYGTFLGMILALLIFIYYGALHYVEYKEIMPYIFLSILIYFYLIGYYICHKTCSFKEGLKTGLISGAVSMLFVGAALFAAHHLFFYNEAISEADNLAGFKSSGLLSMQRYLVYHDIRMSLLALVTGTMFTGFASGVGSYTASNIHKSQTCKTRTVVTPLS